MSEYQNRTPRPKNALDEFKLRLTAKKLDGGDRRPTLSVTVIANNPRIDVYTNLPSDKNRGNIRAAMDAPTFYMLLDAFDEIIDGPNGERIYIENKQPVSRENRQPGKYTPPETVSKTVVGKDGEGCIYISVISVDESRPKIKFVFEPTQYHALANTQGEPLSKAEVSVRYARAYRRMLEHLVANVMDTHYREPEKRGGYGGGNGGGNRSYRGGGNGGGGGNRNNGGGQPSGGHNNGGGDDFGGGGGNDSWDDDIPL